MSYFDKFIKDLERKKEASQKRQEQLKKDNEEHDHRRRVDLYAERWQNQIRYTWGRKK